MGLCQPSNKCLPFEANVAIVTLFNDIQFKIKILTTAVRISVEFNNSDEANMKQHNSVICTLFLCSLDVGNIDDQRRGPSIKEKDHIAG